MRLLVVGGSGFVGTQVVPLLAQEHEIRVFDRRPPTYEIDMEYLEGDVRDFTALAAAAEGTDALLYMAMGPNAGWGSPETVRSHLEVAVPGLHLALRAAHERGVTHAVYTSSMSVFPSPRAGKDGSRRAGEGEGPSRYPDESERPDAQDFYGLAKRLGEEVCRNASLAWGLDVVALRLCHPTPDADWPPTGSPVRATIATSSRDVARAILLALERRGHGFEPFAISGDAEERMVPLGRARTILGWEPADPAPGPS